MPRCRWRLIRCDALSGAQNMALDEALLEEVAGGRSGPVLRLYRWNSPTVTLGYGQRGRHVVNLKACRELGLDLVRRPTGGRAVLHDREATYAVIAPGRSDLFPGDVLGNYRVVAEALQQALASLGLATELAASRKREENGARLRGVCFTAASTHELLFRGCKVTGSAQKRQGGAFLQHGSIPLDLDLSRLCRALDVAHEPSAAALRLLSSSVGWLNRWLSPPVEISELEERLIAAFASCWAIEFEEDGLSTQEKMRAAVLCRDKYCCARWNLEGVL